MDLSFNARNKVKIYYSSQENDWDEYAIGYLQLINDEELGCVFIRVEERTSPGIQQSKYVTHIERNHSKHHWSMNLQLSSDIKYKQQGDFIITWYQPDFQQDLALSFIDINYQKQIFNQIESIIANKNCNYNHFDIIPNLNNLNVFLAQIQEHPNYVINQIITKQKSYLHSLKKIFEEAEANQNLHQLESLYQIFRSLIYLKNDKALIQLLNDDYYLTTFGVLECKIKYKFKSYSLADHDPKNQYRQFLKEYSNFHSVFELSQETTWRIHLSYRLTYLKESVLAYYLYIEDPTYNFLTQVINQNNNQIIESILYSDSFIEFLGNFDQNPISSAAFLNEFSTIFRPQLMQTREQFMSCIKKSEFLKHLHQSITLSLEQKLNYFLCQSLLQFELLIVNIDSYYCQKMFFDELKDLFWKNLLDILECNDLFAAYPLIVDLLLLLFQNQNEKGVDQLKQFLFSCPKNLTFTTIILNLGDLLGDEAFELSKTLIWQLKDFNEKKLGQFKKQEFIGALKLLKFFILKNNEKVLKELMDVIISIFDYENRRKQEGVIEGQIRDIALTLLGSRTLSEWIEGMIPEQDPRRNKELFKYFFEELKAVEEERKKLEENHGRKQWLLDMKKLQDEFELSNEFEDNGNRIEKRLKIQQFEEQ